MVLLKEDMRDENALNIALQVDTINVTLKMESPFIDFLVCYVWVLYIERNKEEEKFNP